MSEDKIITLRVEPPIPIREFDWCAFMDGVEEDGVCGWGENEEEAIADLMWKLEE
jgi:hypothetical protein